MYIPEFACGIFATLIVEVLAAIVWSIISEKKKKK